MLQLSDPLTAFRADGVVEVCFDLRDEVLKSFALVDGRTATSKIGVDHVSPADWMPWNYQRQLASV